MISRETVIEFVSKLPDEMSLVEIARKIECLAGIHTALEQAKLGSGMPVEEARKLADTWAAR